MARRTVQTSITLSPENYEFLKQFPSRSLVIDRLVGALRRGEIVDRGTEETDRGFGSVST